MIVLLLLYHVLCCCAVPGPVRDLLFDNVQDRSLRVTWSEPSEVNGILTGKEFGCTVSNLHCSYLRR